MAVHRNFYSYAKQEPIAATDPLGLFVIDESCDCERRLPDNIPSGIAKAQQWVASPSCNAALTKYPKLKGCVKELLHPFQTGKGPTIRCHSEPPPEGNVCGGYTPKLLSSQPTIHLFPGNKRCPRFDPEIGIGATIFHETLHGCGLLSESEAAEVTKACTGFDARL